MKISDNFIILRKVIIIGFALFSMFFGAGNIIFPLYIGAHSDQYIIYASLGFILSGVGVPLIALIATAQYQGDYWKFFERLGKVPAFLIITLLMIVIGPLSAMPRTSIITFNSLNMYLPDVINSSNIFGVIYFILVFLLSYRESKIIDIIGAIFSPIKIILFTALVVIGMNFASKSLYGSQEAQNIFIDAMNYGYSTMDMFGAFFFCTLAFRSLDHAVFKSTEIKQRTVIMGSFVGAFLLASVYLGFIYLGHMHAQTLSGYRQEQLIAEIAREILGQFGGAFVCIAVSFACLSTAIALARVCTLFLYREIFNQNIPEYVCLILVTFSSYCMSILGFQRLIVLLLPLLQVVYPSLILYSLMSIAYKYRSKRQPSPSFVTTNRSLVVRCFVFLKILIFNFSKSIKKGI